MVSTDLALAEFLADPARVAVASAGNAAHVVAGGSDVLMVQRLLHLGQAAKGQSWAPVAWYSAPAQSGPWFMTPCPTTR